MSQKKRLRWESEMPSVEEFARASRLMKKRSHGLDEVREAVLARFSGITPLHSFHILSQGDMVVRAYIFFEWEKNIEECQCKGVSKEIMDYISSELKRVGGGAKADVKVEFEIDSYENVKKNFNGDFYLRLL